MDEEGEQRVRATREQIVEVDRLRNLPDDLLYEVLLNLPTKDVVKCSVLSHGWRNFWRYVPGFDLKIPLSIYTCESLVFLKLCDVILPKPKSVSLPCVKVISLDRVKFANDWAFAMLILGCSVLESLTVKRSCCDNVKALWVFSESLLSFTHVGHCVKRNSCVNEVEIDAPRLEYLNLFNDQTDRFRLNNLGSLVKVDMDPTFNLSYANKFDPNDLLKRYTISSFLLGISSVKEMAITSYTLEVIYNYSRCETLPLFRNLSSLRADFKDYNWETLPIFLESCPNLKSLTLAFEYPWKKPMSILPGPHSFLPSLEYVEIVKPMRNDDAAEMKLVSYFLKKSTILKEFTFCLGNFRKNEVVAILKKLLAIPRLSSSCQVIVL